MARRGPDHHQPRKQKRGVQTPVCAAVWMVQRDPQVVQRAHDASEPPAVLAPSDAPGWYLWRCEYLHVRESVKHVETIRVWHRPSDIWSAGQAMAKRDGRTLMNQLMSDPECYVELGVVCQGPDARSYES